MNWRDIFKAKPNTEDRANVFAAVNDAAEASERAQAEQAQTQPQNGGGAVAGNQAAQPADARGLQGPATVTEMGGQPTQPTPHNAEGTAANNAAQNGGNGGNGGGRMSMVEMIDRLMPYRPLTDAEIAQEKRRMRSEAVLSSVADGITALTNLYHTTQYAPNMFDPEKSMGARTLSRWQKIKADREQRAKEYLAAYMQAAKMDADKDQQLWLRNNTEKQQQITNNIMLNKDKREAAKEERAAAMHPFEVAIMAAKQREQEAGASVAEANAAVAPEMAALGLEGKRLDNEGKRATNEHTRATTARAWQDYKVKKGENNTTLMIGEVTTVNGEKSDTRQELSIPNEKLNTANIAMLYSLIDEDVRQAYEDGLAIKVDGKTGEPTQEGVTLKDDQRLVLIGVAAKDNPTLQNALIFLSGDDKRDVAKLQ